MNNRKGRDQHPIGTEDEFEASTKRVFDHSVQDMDAATRSRLTQARYAAVAGAEQHLSSLGGAVRRYWLPAGGLTAAAFVAASIVLPRVNDNALVGSTPGAAATLAEDMPMLMESDSVELVEDLDFYAALDDDTLSEDTHHDDASRTAADPAQS
jgi:hypothetical protein